MGQKNESKSESKEWRARIVDQLHNLQVMMKCVVANQKEYPRQRLEKALKEMELRLNRVERKQDALARRLEGSDRHPEDEGWFD